ncbi:MAG: hypothetical protein PUG48_11325 [Clostridia bacterium]|nr:hypothetical protein [Clostridia bacterium]
MRISMAPAYLLKVEEMFKIAIQNNSVDENNTFSHSFTDKINRFLTCLPVRDEFIVKFLISKADKHTDILKRAETLSKYTGVRADILIEKLRRIERSFAILYGIK